jgi:ZIP family zinc transporter
MRNMALWALATGCATSVGAVPFFFVREITRRLYDTLLGFGAGLMLAAATLGLLPAAFAREHQSRFIVALSGFGLGVMLLYLLDRFVPHEHAGGHHGHQDGGEHDAHEDCHHPSVDERARHQGVLLLGAMTLHRIPEGFAIGAAFAADHLQSLGMVMAIAVMMQNAVEGMVMAAPLRRGGFGAGRVIALVSATGLTVPLAAAVGFLLSNRVGSAMPVFLSMAAGALIYLTCNEIIPESHSHKNERQATFGLIAGFVLILLLQALGHTD